MVLQLWVAIRLNTKSTNIVGPETLGMPPDIFDATHPTPGRIPIPPVMGNQIELILSRDIQDPLRNDILDALQKLIYSNKPGCWFTIYLCTFILLHNCSMITKHDSAYARKHGLQVRRPLFSPHLVIDRPTKSPQNKKPTNAYTLLTDPTGPIRATGNGGRIPRRCYGTTCPFPPL